VYKIFLKTTLILLLTILTCFQAFSPVSVRSEEPSELDFDYEVDSALLIEPETEKVLFEKDIYTKVYPASITKIMTLLLAMEDLEEGKISLHDEVEISSRASKMGGTQLFLSPGDRVKLEDLLIGVLVGSANDAAVAVAEHLSGTEEKFVERMNQRARELGMVQTRFQNPHGLHHEEHYTTAYDISLMSRELLNYPQIHEWANIWMDEKFLEGEIKEGEVFLSNTNRMIYYYQGCDGLKTGFHDEAGHSIAATAQRNDTRFLAVVKGASSSEERYQAAKTLLNHGFSHYRSLPIIEKGAPVAVVPVEKGEHPRVKAITAERVSLLVELDERDIHDKEINLPDRLLPPVIRGEKIGQVKVVLNDKERTVDLVAAWEVPPAEYSTLLKRTFSIWLGFGESD